MMAHTEHIFPSFLITVIESSEEDGGYIGIGSRKVNQVTIEHKAEYDSWDYGYAASGYFPIEQRYSLGSELRGFIYVKAATPLAALGALLDAFRKEEIEEEEQKLRNAASAKKQAKQRRKALKKMKKTGRFDDVNSANGLDWEDF